jgi:hypothetical protein
MSADVRVVTSLGDREGPVDIARFRLNDPARAGPNDPARAGPRPPAADPRSRCWHTPRPEPCAWLADSFTMGMPKCLASGAVGSRVHAVCPGTGLLLTAIEAVQRDC